MFYSLNTSTASRIAKRHIDDNSTNAGLTIGKVSSGSRHVRPSTDTSGLVVSNKTRTSIAALQEAQRNISKASSLVQVAAHGYQEATSVISRMRQLAVMVVNDTLSDIERDHANTEYRQLVNQLDATAKMTRFGGRSLLAGGVSSVSVTNANNSAQLNGATVNAAGTEFTGGNDTPNFTAATVLNTDQSSGNFTLNFDDANDISVHQSAEGRISVVLKDGNRVFRANQFDAAQNSALILTEVGAPDNRIALNYVAGAAPLATAADIKTGLETLFDVNGDGSDLVVETTQQGFTGQIDAMASRGFIQHVFGEDQESVDLEVKAGLVTLKIDGETFTGEVVPEANGRLYLQSTDKPENLIALVYANDVSNLQTDQTINTELRSLLAGGRLDIGVAASLTNVQDISNPTTPAAFNTLEPLNIERSSGVVVGQVTDVANVRVAEDGLGEYTVDIILENETFRAHQIRPEANGVLKLTSLSNSGNSFALNYSGDIAGLANAADFETQLEGFLGTQVQPAAQFSIGERAAAYGLSADQTAFGTTLNATYSKGFIDGIAETLKVTRIGEAYEVRLKIGNQEFVENAFVPTNGVLTLVSTTDPASIIAFNVLDATQLRSVETFQSIFSDALGIGDETDRSPVRFRSSDGYNHAHNGFRMGLDATITSSSSTAPGLYGFSYDATTQSFHLSGQQTFERVSYSDLAVNERNELFLLFKNGIKIAIGNAKAPFDPTVSINHTRIEITAEKTLSVEVQVSNDVADDLDFSLPPATSKALGLDATFIGFKAEARLAEDRLTDALETLGTALATAAAGQATLDVLRQNAVSLIEGNIALKGIHADIDMGQEIVNYTSQQTLTQSSVSMLSQANKISETLLRLLP